MSSGARPNIVVITCHDLGRFLGCYGVATVRSAQIDALAAEGVRFSRAFCTAPQCSPSRAALFTGRYPHCTGVLGLTHAEFAWDLGPDERHLGQVLQAAGYATALIGVHHESRAGTSAEIAARCGMDEVILNGFGEAVSDAALDWLARAAADNRPFYLQVGYHEPHRVAAPVRGEAGYMGFIGDYLAPDAENGATIPPYLQDTAPARAELAELQGAVKALDAAVGRLLAGLRERDLAEQTVVVFTTDHGVALPRAKCSLYDPGLETALIVRYPARGWHGGRVIDALTSNIDLFPTLLDLVGLPIDTRVQGRSLLAALDGAALRAREELFGEITYHDYYDPRRCIRTERHKLIVNFSAAPAFMDPSQSWRPRTVTAIPPDPALAYHPPVELYDLAEDPHEWHNLADDPTHDGVRRDLLARLHGWMRDTDDPLLAGAMTSPLHHKVLATLAE